MTGFLAGAAVLPSYVLLTLIGACLLVLGATLYIVGRAILGSNAEPAKRLARLLRAVRGN